jgi:cardiolipin hydrolase
MHHKYAILDERVLMTGSFNWTSSASSLNSENVIVTNDPFFVQAFQKNFQVMWDAFSAFKV